LARVAAAHPDRQPDAVAAERIPERLDAVMIARNRVLDEHRAAWPSVPRLAHRDEPRGVVDYAPREPPLLGLARYDVVIDADCTGVRGKGGTDTDGRVQLEPERSVRGLGVELDDGSGQLLDPEHGRCRRLRRRRVSRASASRDEREDAGSGNESSGLHADPDRNHQSPFYPAAMRLYLVRHAEAAPGTPDELRTLTPEGREQARQLGERLRGEGVVADAVLCSPLLRARETADALGLGRAEPDERLAPG